MTLQTLILMLVLGVGETTYTGTVSEVHTFPSGAVAIDLDGLFPRERMILYLTAKGVREVGALPPVGAVVTCSGTLSAYHDKAEIRVKTAAQWSWKAP